MKEVEVNGTIHEFPDGMSDDAIRQALRRKYSTDQTASMTHTGSSVSPAPRQPSSFGSFIGGLGEGFSNIGLGATQRAMQLTGNPRAKFIEQQVASGRKQKEFDEMLKGKEPASQSFGRSAGEFLPAMGLAFAPGGQTLAGSTISSGLLGALSGAMLPTASNQELAGNIAGGFGGGSAGNFIGRAILPTSARNMTQAQKEILDIARKEGIPLRTSEATGSAAIKNYEQMAANRPGTAGLENVFNERQTRAINRAITSRMGDPVSEINPSTLERFGKEAGDAIGAATRGKQVRLDNDFFNAIVKVDSEYSKGGALTMTPQIKSLVDRAVSLVSSKQNISGETAASIRSKLLDQSRDAFNNENSELGNALKTIVSGLDDAIAGTMTAAEKSAWSSARRRYANYKVVEDIMTRPTREGALGDIPVNRLASAIERSSAGSYAKGRADLADIARLGQVIQPPGRSALLANSGIPYIRSAGDVERNLVMPILQSYPMQTYLTGSIKGQSLLRDSPVSQNVMDGLLRAAGLHYTLMDDR